MSAGLRVLVCQDDEDCVLRAGRDREGEQRERGDGELGHGPKSWSMIIGGLPLSAARVLARWSARSNCSALAFPRRARDTVSDTSRRPCFARRAARGLHASPRRMASDDAGRATDVPGVRGPAERAPEARRGAAAPASERQRAVQRLLHAERRVLHSEVGALGVCHPEDRPVSRAGWRSGATTCERMRG
jgi:hypothetical protein